MTVRRLSPFEIVLAIFSVWMLALMVYAATLIRTRNPETAPAGAVVGAGAMLEDAAEVMGR